MLYQDKVLQFINSHRTDTIKSCNFFYKSFDGKYIDANERAAFIAGVERREMVNKRDFELQWATYKDEYQDSDRLALAQNQEILKVEQGLNLAQQHVPTLTLKQAAIDSNGNPIGIFGTTIYIEEMSFSELFQAFDFIHDSLGIKPLITTPKILLTPALDEEKLTQREKDCAHFLCMGMNAREIAFRLKLSKRTVESYIANMKNKLGAVSKSELIMKLLDNNYIRNN